MYNKMMILQHFTKEEIMYELKFYSTTRYPNRNEDIQKIMMRTLSSLPPEEAQDIANNGRVNRVTTAVLLDMGEEVAKAHVSRYFRDPDIPVLGQKYALEKLLRKYPQHRDLRGKLWEVFWDHSKDAQKLKAGEYKDEVWQVKNGWKYKLLPL